MNDMKKYAGMDYETVLRKYADYITRICVINTGNREDAKDIFQNVFLKLYLTDKEFSNENYLKAWLIRVAINECKDFHKTSWKRKVELGYKEISSEQICGQKDIGYSSECQILIEALQNLSEKYRQIIYLYYCEEFSTREIADMLRMSVNTVKSRLQRGRKKLAERWKIND
ncbi:MAG: RNA polymerase sigma factor [Eubacterium sp.]